MTYTRQYPTWEDWPNVTTPAKAAFFQGVEDYLAGGSSASIGDITISSDTGATGTGDIILQTDGATERARLTNAGTLSFNFGASQSVDNYGVASGQYLDMRLGTSAAPDSGLTPPVKVSRIFHHLSADVTADGAEQLAGISANVIADATSQVQPVALYGAAANSGAAKGASLSPDACGVYGVGRITGSGVGVGMGAFFLGRKDTSTGTVTAVQIASNNSGGSDTSYVSTGVSDCAIFVAPVGANKSGGGLLFTNSIGTQFDVGIGFLGNAAGGNTGAIASASIRDDSHAATSIIINGSHTYGIDLNGGTFTNGPIRLANASPILARNAAGTGDIQMFEVNSANNILAISNLQLAAGLQFNDAKNMVVGTTTGTQIGTASTQKLGFFGATPVVRPSAVGTATGYAAGTTAATFHSDDTYTGNVGTTGYTINGIVAALKNMGFLTA